MNSLSRSESLPVVLVVDDDAPVRSFMRIALEGTAQLVDAPDGEQALRMLERHGGRNLDLEIAREASLSKFHFCRLFHREMGFSFRECLQRLRVRRARALLADPGLSVTEVAYAAGFNDLSHFDKVFRRIVGVPPSEYRKTIVPS